MPQTFDLPVLPLADEVVLPGMVAPDQPGPGEPRPRSTRPSRRRTRGCCSCPRVEGAYGAHGLIAVIEQVGRLPERRARRRGPRPATRPDRCGRVRRGAALWVQATPIDDTPATDRHARAGRVVQGGRRLDPAAARRLAGRRQRAADDRPVRAQRHRRLRAVPRRWSRSSGCSATPTSTSGWRS